MNITPHYQQSPHSTESSASMLNAPPVRVRGGGFGGAPDAPPPLSRLRGGSDPDPPTEDASDGATADAAPAPQVEDATVPDGDEASPAVETTEEASAAKPETGDDEKNEGGAIDVDVDAGDDDTGGGEGEGEGDAAKEEDTEAKMEEDDGGDDAAASTPAKLTRSEMKKRLRPPLGSYEEKDDDVVDDTDDEETDYGEDSSDLEDEEDEDEEDEVVSSEEEVFVRKKRTARKSTSAPSARRRAAASPAPKRKRASPGRPRASPGRKRASPGRKRASPARRGRPARDPARKGIDERWNGMYEELLEYKEEHGDCNVPFHSGKLGRWVKQQRVYYKDIKEGKEKTSSLSADRIARLENIGFNFAQEGLWMKRFNELRRYREQRGDAMVPKDWSDNLPLARWVEHQRKEYRKRVRGQHSTLTEDRMSMLRELDFDFNVAGKRGPKGRSPKKARRYDDEDDVEIRVVVIDGVEKEIEVRPGESP